MTQSLAAPPEPAKTSWRAYARLAKLSFFDYYLAAFVVWTMLEPSARGSARVLVTLAVLTLGWIGVCGAAVSFDDVTGFRDGSDPVNYDPNQEQLRNRSRKPLLQGELTIPQALRFGYALLLAGIAALAVALSISPHLPGWTLAATPLLVVVAVQYSYGLRLSYHGGQELALFLSTALVVFIPFGLAHGSMTHLAVMESYLFGLWSVLVSLYSNINDRAGDITAGRRNLATMLAPRTYHVVITLLSATELGAVLVGCASGGVPWWFLAMLSPMFVLRARQVQIGVGRGDVLVARKLGGQAHRLGVVLVVVGNLLAVR